MKKGIFLSLFDFTQGDERAFSDWLEREYFPRLKALKGFERGRLWAVNDNPKLAVMTFDTESADVFRTPDWTGSDQAFAQGGEATENCRIVLNFEGEQVNPGDQLTPADAGGMLLVASNAAADFQPEYADWYDQEHLPALRAVPGTLSARRFRATRSSRQFLSLYHLISPDVQASAAWKKAVDTAWSSKVRPQVRDRARFVCRARG